LNWDHYAQKTGLIDAFIAEKVGVTRMSVGYFRRGQRKPSKATDEKMAALFKEHLEAQAEYHERQAKQARMLLIGIDVWNKQKEIEGK